MTIKSAGLVSLFSIENPKELIGNAQMICFERVERFRGLTSHFSQNFEGKIFGISEFVAGFEYDRWGGDTGIEDIGGEAESPFAHFVFVRDTD